MNVLPMKDISTMKELLANADQQLLQPIKEYKRADLKAVLTKKYWAMIEPLGEPNVEGDADVEAINAHRAAHVIRYAIDSHSVANSDELTLAMEREMKLAKLFSAYSFARGDVVACIAKKTPQTEIDQTAQRVTKLKSLGWDMVRQIEDGTYIGLRTLENGRHQFVTNLSEMDFRISYMYTSRKTAEKAFKTWNGVGDPYVNGGGWLMIVADGEHPKYEQMK